MQAVHPLGDGKPVLASWETCMSGYWRHLCLSLGLALFVATPLFAAETDPPGRVGRISLASEGTQLRVGESVASGEAALNWPLTTGALIETASQSRAEARIGSTTLRIDGGSSLEFVELSDELIWLRLNRGSVVLGIQNPEHAAEMALDTPQGRLRIDAPGTYRADVAGGTTAFSAYQGAAHIDDPGLTVRAGDRILLLGGADRGYLLGQAAVDGFRQWSLVREQLDARGGHRYVSPEMTGHEELQRHGTWQETAEYGPAWFPQGMPSGWAPYRWGRWSWVAPWGWTWVDHAPWGFAPFHYGRWALIGGNWAWIPGTYVAKPVYAPALIVWLGQPGWSASFSFGAAPAVGWFPLGPREAYYPHYRSSLRHVRNVNVTHVANITRIAGVTPPPQGSDRHVHRGRHEAITIVPEKTVLSGAAVNRSVAVQDSRRGFPTAPIAQSPSQPTLHQDMKASGADAAPLAKTALPVGASSTATHTTNMADQAHRPLTRGNTVPTRPPVGISPARPAAEPSMPLSRPTAVPMPKQAYSARTDQPAPFLKEGTASHGSRSHETARGDRPAATHFPASSPPVSTQDPQQHPRHLDPRPMPSQPSAGSLHPAPQRQAPAADSGRDHAPRADHVQRDGRQHGPREPRNRELSKTKPGSSEH